MILKIFLCILTLLIAIWPIASVFQSAICGFLIRIFIPKEMRNVVFVNWPWYIKVVSFFIALLFWFSINEGWKYLTNSPMPLILVGGIYVVIALYTKNKKGEMSFIFRANKTNEVYATLSFFIYQIFISNGINVF